MRYELIALIGRTAVVGTVVYVAPAFIAGQASSVASKAKAWTRFKTPWGDPDLQGVGTNHHGVPLERPSNLEERMALTDQEVAELETQAAQNRDRAVPGQTGTYNAF